MMIKKTTTPLKKQQTLQVSMRRRLAAILYDWLLCLACLFVFVAIAVTLNQGYAMTPQQQPFLSVGLLGVVCAYFVGFWRQGGQTPGMKVWKLQLVANQPPATVNKLLIRFSVVLFTAGLAVLWGVFTPDRQGLHDKLSNTSLRRSL